MVEFDAVYPFAGDPWELSHSVRLLRKHSKVRNIYVIGDDPGLDVIHVPFIEMDVKETNIWKKTLAACFIPGLSERFLFINDDHFILKDFDDLPAYYGAYKDDDCGPQYQQAVARTFEKLMYMGLNTKYFDVHYPCFFEKPKFIECFKVFNGAEHIMKSAYFNFYNCKGVEIEDKKLKFLATTDQIERFIGDSWCFSTNDISADLHNFITQL